MDRHIGLYFLGALYPFSEMVKEDEKLFDRNTKSDSSLKTMTNVCLSIPIAIHLVIKKVLKNRYKRKTKSKKIINDCVKLNKIHKKNF